MIDHNLRSAVISTIHIEPEYRFVGSERQLALRMTKMGLLKQRTDDPAKFTVTKKGEQEYIS